MLWVYLNWSSLFAVRFALHHHFLQCLLCGEQDFHMYRIYGWWVFLLRCFLTCCLRLRRRDLREQPSSVSLLSIHLHFCRSKDRLIAVSCLAWLCAKSYKGVINLDWSAFGDVCTGVRSGTVRFLGVCLSKCVLMQWFPCFTHSAVRQ